MVPEWLEGKPLDAVIEQERVQGPGLRSLEETVRLLDAAAEALALAHRKGIAHRDVKPANVFVLGDPRGHDTSVKPSTSVSPRSCRTRRRWASARRPGIITSFTPSHGAPEQFNRSYGSTGPWTDVFALALVVTEIGERSRSARRRDPRTARLRVVRSEQAPHAARARPPDLGRGRGGLPEGAPVKPEDRYQNAGDFWDAARRCHRASHVDAVAARAPPPASAKKSDEALAATALFTDKNAETSVAPASASPVSAPASASAPMSAPVSREAPRSPRPSHSSPPACLAVAGIGGFVAFARPATRRDMKKDTCEWRCPRSRRRPSPPRVRKG